MKSKYKLLNILLLWMVILISSCAVSKEQGGINKNTIVFLGNSITKVGKWQELLADKTIINKGISGDITTGVLARLDDCLAAKPEKIFVMIGVNDLKIGKAIDTITANQKKIIAKIKTLSPKTKIYMQSTLPVHENMLADIYKRLNNKDISQMNVALKQLCKQMKVGYIDLYAIMLDENSQLKKSWSTDGLHLKPDAYEAWVAYLKTNKLL